MPSNYTGNPAATQSPSSAPAPGVAPIGALPADGDADSGATFAQAFKVCLDFIAYAFTKMVFGDGTRSAKALTIDGTGNQTVTANASHLVIAGSNPTPSAGAGSGTGPTISVTASSCDARGTIQVTTGTAPTASATIVQLTYTNTYTNAPSVILYPGNAATAALSGNSSVFVSSVSGFFQIVAGSTALAATTAYTWNYVVIGA